MNRYRREIAQTIRKIRTRRSESLNQLTNAFNSTEPLELQTTRTVLNKYELGTVSIPAEKYLKLIALDPK